MGCSLKAAASFGKRSLAIGGWLSLSFGFFFMFYKNFIEILLIYNVLISAV